MSRNLVSTVYESFPGGGVDLNIFQAIAEYATEAGCCYVSQGRLAAAARCSRVATRMAIVRLRAERWVIAGRVLGQGNCLAYQINIPKLERSKRPDHDPNAHETDAKRASRLAQERRARKYGVPAGEPNGR